MWSAPQACTWPQTAQSPCLQATAALGAKFAARLPHLKDCQASWHCGVHDSHWPDASCHIAADFWETDDEYYGEITLYCCRWSCQQELEEFWDWGESLTLESDLECEIALKAVSDYKQEGLWARARPTKDKYISLSLYLQGVLRSMGGLCLQKLTVTMGGHHEIYSRVLLPKIAELRVYSYKWVNVEALQLDWLLHQPYGQLHLDMGLSATVPRILVSDVLQEHRRTVCMLQQLHITSLRLRQKNVFPAAAQSIWAQLRIAERLHLYLSDWADGEVHALPCCHDTSIERLVPFPRNLPQNFGSAPPPLQVSWSAIGLQPGRVHICMLGLQRRQIVGFTSLISSGPWQLVVHSAAGVEGLPACRPFCEPYLLQNAAADAAGWDCTVLDSCRCLWPLHDGGRAWL